MKNCLEGQLQLMLLMYSRNMRNRISLVLICFTFMLGSCAGTSGVSDAQACRTLKLAKGASLDLEMAVIQQNPENLHEILPPTNDAIAKFDEVKSSLNALADKLGSGDKADLARQLSSDLDTMLQDALAGRMLSMETGSALSSDATQVIALCGF